MSIETAALVQNNVVVNTVLVDVDEEQNVVGYEPPEDHILVRVDGNESVSIGWTFTGEAFEPPEDAP